MKVLITGSNGMLGSALRQTFQKSSRFEIICWTRSSVDLLDGPLVKKRLIELKPDLIIHTAAVVGGIQANINHPVAHLAENLLIDSSVMLGALSANVENVLYVGSSCMYPKDYRQPLLEKDILAAPLEPTNEGYAIAKIAGSKLADSISSEYGLNYRTIIPSNLYGPGDNFSDLSSHLIAAVIRKTMDAKKNSDSSIEVWGDGTARREFTFIYDLANWVVLNAGNISKLPAKLNLGAGIDHSINTYYQTAMEVCDYQVPLTHDLSKPVGMKSKLMDSSIAREYFNWRPATSLKLGMAQTLEYYLTRNGAN